jgi:AcrR family transcriptional regulator
LARPVLHPPDAILDAARDLVAEGGRKAATVKAIERASRAPSGSIYHRFGSQDRVLIEAWIRAVKRFQAGFLEAIVSGPPLDSAIAAALWTPRFAREHPGDATLLLQYRREDLMRSPLTDLDLLGELSGLNDRAERSLRRLSGLLYGGVGRRGYEAVVLAVVDLPHGAVRRYLSSGTDMPPDLPARLEAAVRAALEVPVSRPRRP